MGFILAPVKGLWPLATYGAPQAPLVGPTGPPEWVEFMKEEMEKKFVGVLREAIKNIPILGEHS